MLNLGRFKVSKMLSCCVICFDSFAASSEANSTNVSIVATMCGHVFHYSCLEKWLKRARTCPECRKYTSYKSLTRLFINCCTEEERNSEESLESLTERLSLKRFECVEKDKIIKELHTSYACAVSESFLKDEKLKDLQTICNLSKLESLEKGKIIEALQTSVASTELENVVKDEKIKELEVLFASSELENLEKDGKIKELQNYFAFSVGYLEKARHQQAKLISKIFVLKEEVSKLNCVAAKDLMLLPMNNIIQKEKNLESELQNLNSVEMIVKGCFIDIKEILADKQIHIISEEGKDVLFKISSYCSLIKQAVVRSKEDSTFLRNELTKVKQELALSKDDSSLLRKELAKVKQELVLIKEDSTYLENKLMKVKQELSRTKLSKTNLLNELEKVKQESAKSKDEPQLPIEFKLVKRKMSTSKLDSVKRIRLLNKTDDLNSSSSTSLSCCSSLDPIVPSVSNSHSSQCSNRDKSALACSLSSGEVELIHFRWALKKLETEN